MHKEIYRVNKTSFLCENIFMLFVSSFSKTIMHFKIIVMEHKCFFFFFFYRVLQTTHVVKFCYFKFEFLLLISFFLCCCIQYFTAVEMYSLTLYSNTFDNNSYNLIQTKGQHFNFYLFSIFISEHFLHCCLQCMLTAVKSVSTVS